MSFLTCARSDSNVSDAGLTIAAPSPPPSASKQPAKMQNDKGANVDLYIPRKWCVARPRARARAYEPVLAACLDAARPPCPAAAARRAGLAAAGLALAALARMRQGCRGARGAALSARGGGRGDVALLG